MALNIAHALQTAKKCLATVSDSPASDAQFLLCAALAVGRAHLLAYPEQVLTPEQATRWEAWLARAAAGEPLPYIIGHRAFYDREFWVTPDVLIPRPETELLLEHALTAAAAFPAPVVVDVGTGSGALAVTLAAHVPAARVFAIDRSPAALAVAQRNAAAQGVNVTFWAGDLLLPCIQNGLRVDVVMANLPYIPSRVVDTLPVSQWEPRAALDGGADGLDLVRRLLAQVPQACAPDAALFLEIGYDQGEAALTAAQAALPEANVRLWTDLAGLDRLVCIRCKK